MMAKIILSSARIIKPNIPMKISVNIQQIAE